MAASAGTTTFLFTDIEGNAGLWERALAVMGAALRRHDTILRGLVRGACPVGGFGTRRLDDARRPRFRRGARQGPVAGLAEALRGRSPVLVLDHREPLIDAAAELGESLIRTCPGVRVLATGREPLNILGEHNGRVASMRAQIGEDAFATAYAEGERLSNGESLTLLDGTSP